MIPWLSLPPESMTPMVRLKRSPASTGPTTSTTPVLELTANRLFPLLDTPRRRKRSFLSESLSLALNWKDKLSLLQFCLELKKQVSYLCDDPPGGPGREDDVLDGGEHGRVVVDVSDDDRDRDGRGGLLVPCLLPHEELVYTKKEVTHGGQGMMTLLSIQTWKLSVDSLGGSRSNPSSLTIRNPSSSTLKKLVVNS